MPLHGHWARRVVRPSASRLTDLSPAPTKSLVGAGSFFQNNQWLMVLRGGGKWMKRLITCIFYNAPSLD